jgi:hypothetical protein
MPKSFKANLTIFCQKNNVWKKLILTFCARFAKALSESLLSVDIVKICTVSNALTSLARLRKLVHLATRTKFTPMSTGL